MVREVSKSNPPLDKGTLASFEARHSLDLPRAYRDFMLRTNGGRPAPAVFPIRGFPKNPAGVIQAFFGLNASRCGNQ